jgi:hypothetical protein
MAVRKIFREARPMALEEQLAIRRKEVEDQLALTG